jgi:hypothetical protein
MSNQWLWKPLLAGATILGASGLLVAAWFAVALPGRPEELLVLAVKLSAVGVVIGAALGALFAAICRGIRRGKDGTAGSE